jgi:hypothetical protein
MTLIQLPIVLNQRIPDFTSEEELRCKWSPVVRPGSTEVKCTLDLV